MFIYNVSAYVTHFNLFKQIFVKIINEVYSTRKWRRYQFIIKKDLVGKS